MLVTTSSVLLWDRDLFAGLASERSLRSFFVVLFFPTPGQFAARVATLLPCFCLPARLDVANGDKRLGVSPCNSDKSLPLSCRPCSWVEDFLLLLVLERLCLDGPCGSAFDFAGTD